MKKALFVILCALLAAIGPLSAQQVVVAVAPFEALDGTSASDARAIAEIFGIELQSTGVVRVVSRGNFEATMREHRFQMSDLSSDQKTAELAKGINAQWVVRGQVQKLGTLTVVTATLLEVNTLEIMGGAPMYLSSIEETAVKMDGFIGTIKQRIGGSSSPSRPAEQSTARQSASANTGGSFSQQQTIQAIDANMVRISGGTFMMGSPAGAGNANERPQHQVSLGGFSIGKYEVTQAEYEAVMGRNPSGFKASGHPVETVSWLDAVEFCNKLSQAANLTPVYMINGATVTWNNSAQADPRSAGYRLPTEAEWEYACGEWIDGWLGGSSGGMTHPVGQLAPNRHGLYDMIGNVWEWCWDWYGNYGREPQSNPRGPASGAARVRRGLNWGTAGRPLLTNRDYGVPSDRGNTLGFRLARSE